MKTVENIDKRLPFTVPENYFHSLPERVMARCSAPPVEQQEPQHHSLWATIRPQLALAAGFALLVGVGSLAVKLISAPASNEVATSSYINTHDVEAYEERQQRFAAEGSDDEAIVEYLLMAGNVRFL